IVGDIRDRGLLDDILKKADYCFHMAALRINQCNAEPRETLEVMMDGTFNVADACVKHGIKKIILASFASVYGMAENFPTDESHHPYNNRTLYGALKLANEGIFRSFKEMYGLDYTAMRGDGKQTMDFVYVEDVARANIMALKSDVTDEVLNVGNGVETSLEELCHLLLDVMASELEPEFMPLPDQRRVVEVGRRLADVTKAKKKIGFEAEVPLRDGLRKLVSWLEDTQANGDRRR
ncbi:MAG: NAD-dependent epimerase/dehydratase family protein, partial [Deltaproteobacteria bacterium]|nr:NAD-dependent epimerase/dehydratase family protein [Deltaproteobacteria bacterium]